MIASAKRPRGDGPSTEARLSGLLGIQQCIDPLAEGLLEAAMTRGGENGTGARKRQRIEW
jgi:hypothetical protein